MSLAPHRDGQDDDDSKIARLARWFEDNSIWLHPGIELRYTDATGCAVFLRDGYMHLETQTIVGIIPKISCLSARTSGLAPYLGDSLPLFSAESACGLVLALCLLYEHLLGEQSKWYGYISALPRQRPGGELGISLPYEWPANSSQRTWLKGSEVERVLQRAGKRASLPDRASRGVSLYHVEYFLHRTGLPILQEALPDQHLTDSSLLSSFLGAFSLVSSRAFVCDVYHGLVLAPLADAFNHSDDNDVQFECEDDVCFRCGALAACQHRGDVDTQRTGQLADTIDMTLRGPVIAHGDGSAREIFNSYGPLSNGRLLVSYGFAQATETEWERFAWDWDDEQERAQVTAALELEDAEARQRWADVCATLAGQAIQQALLAPAAEQTRRLQVPTPSPFYRLGSETKPVGDLFALPQSPDDVDGFTHDEDYPLFVDGDGNVSICLWRAAWASVVAREDAKPDCEDVFAELAESEQELSQVMSEEAACHSSTSRARERARQVLALIRRLLSQRRAGLSVSSPEKEQQALDLLDQGDDVDRPDSLPKDATVRYALLCAIQEHAALRAAESRLGDAIEMLQQGAKMTR